jgi:hypothetical protein
MRHVVEKPGLSTMMCSASQRARQQNDRLVKWPESSLDAVVPCQWRRSIVSQTSRTAPLFQTCACAAHRRRWHGDGPVERGRLPTRASQLRYCSLWRIMALFPPWTRQSSAEHSRAQHDTQQGRPRPTKRAEREGSKTRRAEVELPTGPLLQPASCILSIIDDDSPIHSSPLVSPRPLCFFGRAREVPYPSLASIGNSLESVRSIPARYFGVAEFALCGEFRFWIGSDHS